MSKEGQAINTENDQEEDDKATVVIDLDGLEDLMGGGEGLSSPASTQASSASSSVSNVNLDDIFDRSIPEEESQPIQSKAEVPPEESEEPAEPAVPEEQWDDLGGDTGDELALEGRDGGREQAVPTEAPQENYEELQALPEVDDTEIQTGKVSSAAVPEVSSSSEGEEEGGIQLEENEDELLFEKKEEKKPGQKGAAPVADATEIQTVVKDDYLETPPTLTKEKENGSGTGTMEIKPTDLGATDFDSLLNQSSEPLPSESNGDFREFKFKDDESIGNVPSKDLKQEDLEYPDFISPPSESVTATGPIIKIIDTPSPIHNDHPNPSFSSGGKEHLQELAESHKEFVNYHENELIKLSSIIKGLREDREKLIRQVDAHELENKDMQKKHLGLLAEHEELKIEMSIIKKGHRDEVDRLQYQLKILLNKRDILEEQNRGLKEEYGQMQQKMKIDVRKVRGHEQELENQLELLRADSAAQLLNREQMITELKRQIENMEFDVENMTGQEKKMKEHIVVLENKLQKVMKALSSGLDFLAVPEVDAHKAKLVKKVKY